MTYVLHSPRSGQIYIGFTSDLINRMQSHNIYSKKGHTVRFRPWIVVHVEYFESKKEAMQREKWFKTGVGREFIRKNILII